MIDDAQTEQFRRMPVAALPVGPPRAAPSPVTPWPGAPVPSTPWGPPPAGLGGPGVPMYPGIAPPPDRRPRWPWVLGAVAAVVVVLGLFGTVLAPSATVSGTVTFYASNSLALGSSCNGRGWYSDLAPGQSILVYDGQGQQVGQGSLGPGSVVSSSSSSYGYGNACQFSYSVPVASSDSYRVVVGRRHGVVFSADQADGHADIAIGS